MKYLLTLLFFSILLTSCGSDDSRSCTTCNSEITIAFTLCEENNGNASINGEDTGTAYAIYFDGLVAAGTSCGE